MTKKEKLINWSREKFKNDEEGVLLIIENSVSYSYSGGRCIGQGIECCSILFHDFEGLSLYLELYNDNLVKLEDECLNNEDIGIKNYYWKSGEDIKYFKEE